MWDVWSNCVDRTAPETRAVLERVQYGLEDDEDNIEELLSRCDAWLQFGDDASVREFRNRSLGTLLTLCRAPEDAGGDISSHKEFLRRLARRRARDPRLKVFTTNYDRCFELAAGQLGLISIDGFSFAQPRRFDPRFFDYDLVNRARDANDTSAYVPGVFHYYKLHGSVDWRFTSGGVFVDPDAPPGEAALIYPASTKFKFSYQQPYLELIAHYLAALREPNTCILVVGFGFNDAHLSEPILSALSSNPHLRVIVVDPQVETSLGSNNEEYEPWRRLEQLSRMGADIGFVGMPFDEFVSWIPDLRALSPAERLVKAVEDVVA